MLCLFSVGGRRTVSEPSIQLTDGASCATEAGNATVFGPPYLEAREQEPPFVPRTCSPSLLGLLAKLLLAQSCVFLSPLDDKQKQCYNGGQ